MMKMAYADPPYYGSAKKHYGKHHPEASEYDDILAHKLLVGRLMDEYTDGWALSMTSNNLHVILPLCPTGARIAAWVKPFHVYKKGVRPAYAWEPVVFYGGRNKKPPVPEKGGPALTPKDFISCNITLKKGLVGAKPPEVCGWILDLLGWQPGDIMDDLFPGTGIMDRVVAERNAQAL